MENFTFGFNEVLVDNSREYIFVINYAIFCMIVSLYGIATNILNIIVFKRQGFKETINISLISLSISDLLSLISLLWVAICYNPYFMYSDLPVLTLDLQHFPGAWTHVIFTRVTGLITVFITFERCLCIAFPLKVKTILTPKRVKMIVILMYFIIIGSLSATYSNALFGWVYVERLNRSMIGNIYTAHRAKVNSFSYPTQLFYHLSSFSAVVLFTVILVYKINQRSKWRQSVTAGDRDNDKSTLRDRQVVKMVVYVATIFIVSFIPSLVLVLGMMALPEMKMGGKEENLFILIGGISFTFAGVNASVNFFVYYKTSSRYKKTVQEMFFNRKNPDVKMTANT